MKKRTRHLAILLLGALLLLASCGPGQKDEEVKTEDNQEKQEVSILPSYQLSDKDYKMLLPFKPSEARGVIVGQVANRLDIEEVEDGLRRHSTDYFSTEDHFYEEGQYLSRSTVYSWLERNLTDKQLKKELEKEAKRREREGLNINEDTTRERLLLGLNPSIEDPKDEDDHIDNPRYLSHILEQNYLMKNEENGVTLEGVSIGIVLKSTYRYQVVEGRDQFRDIPMKEMLTEGEKIAETVLERLRDIEELEDVPIMMALYREDAPSSPIPGNFVSKTLIPGDESSIKDWQTIDEDYVLFPSSGAQEKNFDDYELVKSFGKEISEYFPNYVGYIGEGFYIDDELQKLSIEIPIEFFGAAEVIGFTQYTYGVVKSMFPNRYDLEIKIQSSEKLESLIYWNEGEEEPTVHIFH